MEKRVESDTPEAQRPPETAPAGGVPLSQERQRALAEQWKRTRQSLRIMDEAPLGDTEPATLFVWRSEKS